MRVLIVPDKFKGSLSANEAAAAIARGWKRARPGDDLDLLPMSDGGDGFGAVMSRLLSARPRWVNTVDAAHRPRRVRWWWAPHTRTALIDSAEVIGLALLPPKRFHPHELDTLGVARVVTAAARLKPRQIIMGVGGSATNDGGFGLARGLGWRFVSSRGDEISAWPNLTSCEQILPPANRLRVGTFTVALDVQNPLLGAKGCTRVYGPQKGLRPTEFKATEAALKSLSEAVRQLHGTSPDRIGGAGAAGGLGFGLMSFLKAYPRSGFVLFAQAARLRSRIRRADLVITGEGCLDRQSIMGKGVGELLTLCEHRKVPCLAIGGEVDLPRSCRARFLRTYSLTERVGSRRALEQATSSLTTAATNAGADLTVTRVPRSREDH